MLAAATVLWRTGHGAFSLTGWGWIALLFVLSSIEEIGRNYRKKD